MIKLDFISIIKQYENFWCDKHMTSHHCSYFIILVEVEQLFSLLAKFCMFIIVKKPLIFVDKM